MIIRKLRAIPIVPDWKHSWKWISQNCFIIAGALSMSWASLGSLQSAIPPQYVTGIAGVICVLGFIGRLIDQAPKPPEEQP
jgi:hypothetical protein